MNRWVCLRGHGTFDQEQLASKGGEMTCPRCLAGGSTILTSTLKAGEMHTFPIHSSTRVTELPWALIQPCWRRLMLNFGSSLSDMVLRGGLSASEAVAVLEDQPFIILTQLEAELYLVQRIAELT